MRMKSFCRVVAVVWEKDVWEFQAKSGSSGSCGLFLHFLGKIAVQEMSGKTPGSPRHPLPDLRDLLILTAFLFKKNPRLEALKG